MLKKRNYNTTVKFTCQKLENDFRVPFLFGNIDDSKRSHSAKIEILENLKGTFGVTF